MADHMTLSVDVWEREGHSDSIQQFIWHQSHSPRFDRLVIITRTLATHFTAVYNIIQSIIDLSLHVMIYSIK